MLKSGKATEVKGRVEEASGMLRGDDEQRAKGKSDQVSGRLKQANEKLKSAAGNVKDALKK